MLNLKSLRKTRINSFRVFYRNEKELRRIYKEVFVNQEYKFSPLGRSPFIIDCGSHIGLSILYFKEKYPQAKILGFEPNPENFKILRKNIQENKLTNIKVINAAVADKEGKIKLHVSFKENDPWTWGDTIIYNMWGDGNDDKKVEVKTVTLSKYINRPVDLLKIDIEGAEQKVLQESGSKLHFVKEIAMEYHGTKTGIKVNDFSVIKQILERNGFVIKTKEKILGLTFPDLMAKLLKTSMLFTVRATSR